MGADNVRGFLSYLTNECMVSMFTCKQALCALLFLYKQVLGTECPWLDDLHRPHRAPRRPTVLTEQAVSAVFAKMKGIHALMARLLYGTGMRLMERMMLRVKDVNFSRREITIRFGKGGKDRRTAPPVALAGPLRE